MNLEGTIRGSAYLVSVLIFQTAMSSYSRHVLVTISSQSRHILAIVKLWQETAGMRRRHAQPIFTLALDVKIGARFAGCPAVRR